jgi:hypothetical protein
MTFLSSFIDEIKDFNAKPLTDNRSDMTIPNMYSASIFYAIFVISALIVLSVSAITDSPSIGVS